MTTVTRKDSKKDRYHVETCITWTPCEPSPMEEDGGHVSDLFACPDTGDFFTVKNMKVETTARNINTSKTFLCPVCTSNTPLIITPSTQRKDGQAVARCPNCDWDTSNCNVDDMGDLLQRVKMPYPWLETHFRTLKANRVNTATNNIETQHLDDNNNNNNDNNSSRIIHSRGSKSKIGSHSKVTERLAMLHRRGSIINNHHDNKEKPVTDMSAFTEKQIAHENHIFQSFMPQRNLPKNHLVNIEKKYDIDNNNLSEMTKEDLLSTELMEGDDRKASGIYFKKQGGPIQKVKPPHVVIKSAFTNKVVNSRWDATIYEHDDHMECTAAYIIPKVMINVKGWGSNINGICGPHDDETDLLISVRNERQLAAYVQIFNCLDKKQVLESKLSAGEQFTTKLKNVKWVEKNVEQHIWLDGLCNRVVQLEMHVKYDMKRGKNQNYGQSTIEKWQRLCRQTWKTCLFVRHHEAVPSLLNMSENE